MTSWSESELDSDNPMVNDDNFDDDDWDDDEGPDELEFGEEKSGNWSDDQHGTRQWAGRVACSLTERRANRGPTGSQCGCGCQRR